MSTRYKFIDKEAVYFTTSTVVGWCDVFTRDCYKTILLESTRYCHQNQGLQIHACGTYDQPAHTICSYTTGKDLGDIWRNCKSFTALKLIDAIIKNPKESRKEHLL
jgi:putative transposase